MASPRNSTGSQQAAVKNWNGQIMSDRKNFGRLPDVLSIPDLIEIQTKSFQDFLQPNVPPMQREYKGLQEVFKDTFSADWSENATGLEFVSYDLEAPKVPLVDCLKDGGTYQASLFATFRLTRPGQKESKEERIHIGEMPIMSERGSFVINGAERVIVSQLHRSPGVCFERTKHASGKDLFSYKIVADHGSWLEVQYDNNGLMWIFLDRKHRRRKFLISTFLRAFGLSTDRELLDAVYRCFYHKQTSMRLVKDKYGRTRLLPMFAQPGNSLTDAEENLNKADLDAKDKDVLPRWLGVQDVPIEELLALDNNELAQIYTAEPVFDPSDSKTKIIEELSPLTERALLEAQEAGLETVAAVDTHGLGDTFINCIIKEHREPFNIADADDARKDIYKKLRPQDTPNESSARLLFFRQFEDIKHYDLARVGRYRIFKRLGISPLADFDLLMSSEEKEMREKSGKVPFEGIKNAVSIFSKLISEYNDDLEKLDEDQHVLRVMFSSPEEGLADLIRPMEDGKLENADQVRSILATFARNNYVKFLSDVTMDEIIDEAGGVLSVFLNKYMDAAKEAVKKACARVGIGTDLSESKKSDKAYKGEEAILKAIADTLENLASNSIEEHAAFLRNPIKPVSSKKANAKMLDGINLVIRELLKEIIKQVIFQVQEFVKGRRYLTAQDIAAATAYMMRLRNNCCAVDDIDHLGRRRVRTIGELLQNQCRVGLARIINGFREKINGPEGENASENASITKYLNPKPLASVIRDFFGRNQLSQFMDQTNALAELTNKRRLSALGPGGLTRERAGFEVRDVHSSHYGRVCPIETPEGPNIGLISSLALYAKLDEFGFINTPYRRVENSTVTKTIDYLTADREEDFVIAQANAAQDAKGKFTEQYILVRKKGESAEVPKEEVNYIDVSPKQLISAAAGLIPFLEHDDANRALMGSNMQRQAVPLLKAERPLVGTGLEEPVARYSRASLSAAEDGIVASADAQRIIITKDGKEPNETAYPESVHVYDLYKFLRSNASTLVNQHPIVKRGQVIKKDQPIADGASTDGGELSLGRNVLVAFMSWHGYNFEDAIIISERLVANDVYTSIHVSLEDVTARDTKIGPEEITRDIPNVSEDSLRNLDSEGIVRVGAEVKAGDVLVGKITPKNEGDLAPEERLLKAIFGEKASDVKDSSLLVPGGLSGIVMDVRVDRKADTSKGSSGSESLKAQLKEANAKYNSKADTIKQTMLAQLSPKFLQKKISCNIKRVIAGEEEVIIEADRKITKSMLNKLVDNYDSFTMRDCEEKAVIEEIVKPLRNQLRDNEQCRKEEVALIEANHGEEIGKVRGVKVYIASKRKISVGDKMAGRHGNKGIVAKIVPVEDMPFMADGTPVDIILNPLGVPSRMNIGQVFETHVGWAAKVLGYTVATPVFDGIQESKIFEMLEEARKIKVAEQGWTIDKDGHVRDEAGHNRDDCFIGAEGKVRLYDGRTGDPFAQRIMVGQIYMLKLDHLVANKIHARAVGSYSLVTQQPLGGKAQHGGQRFGEMEVWALEAYGAAYTLQEMLTVKSDDTKGRTEMYESIMKGNNTLKAGRPESFNVLMNEMKSLCLDIKLHQSKND